MSRTVIQPTKMPTLDSFLVQRMSPDQNNFLLIRIMAAGLVLVGHSFVLSQFSRSGISRPCAQVHKLRLCAHSRCSDLFLIEWFFGYGEL